MKYLLLLSLIVGFSAFTLWRAQVREAAFEAEFPPLGQITEVNGVPFHYVDRGEGPAIVLIHGSSGNLRDFTFSMVDKLADRYRVIAVDRPGMGYTGRLGGRTESISDQAAFIVAAMAQIGVEKPIVLGQSYGGAVALAWALEHPDSLSALVLVASPSQPWDGSVPGLYQMNGSAIGSTLAVPIITAFVPRSYIEEQIDAVFDPEQGPEGYGDYVGAELAARRISLRANAEHRVHLLAEITAQQPFYPQLTLPIEMIHGEADTTVPLSIHALPFSRQVASANLTTLPGIGHLPHHTAEAETLAAIDRAARRAGLR